MEWQTKGAGQKIQKTPDPATNVSERAAMDQALQMYRMGVSKGKQTAKGAGKGQPHGGKNGWGKGKSEPPKWTCSFCFDKNVSHHSWCNAVGCGMHYLDAAHLTEEAMTGSRQAKGKGKGKDKGKGKGKGGAGSKDAGAAEAPPKDPPAVSAEEPKDAKCLLTMGLYPAPEVDKLKPYPKPAPKADDSERNTAAELKVQQLEAALAEATTNGFPASILNLHKKEIAAAKEEQAKATKGGPAKGILWEALEKRVANAELAASAAKERHQAQVAAVDGQILQLQKIREHKIADFMASQEAFAARVVEDRRLLAEKIAASPVSPPAVANVGYSSLTAMVDLHRHHDVDEVDIPPCPSTMVASEVNAMASLWHFYHAVGPFAVIPAITFEALQVCPSFAHTLVGNSVWEGYWKDVAHDVKGSQYIPVSLHNVLKHVLHAMHVELSAIATAKETALARYAAAKALATQRRSDVDPF